MTIRITLRDVARQTGFSTATVSLALRNHPRLPKKTCVTIQRAAKKMGYQPDPVLSSVAASRWRGHRAMSTLALIKDTQDAEGENGLMEQATRLGFKLEAFNIHDYENAQRLSDILYHRGITGVLVAQIFTPGFCESFNWSYFSTVAISEGTFRPPVHLVMPNHFRAVQGAWDYAVARGFKRIGMAIYDMPWALDFHDRRSAFGDRQRDVPAKHRVPVLALNPWHSQEERLAAVAIGKKWADQHQPDCMLGFNDIFWWLLRDTGWRGIDQPDGFVALWKTSHEPKYPGFLVSPDEIGRRAVDWLDSLLRTCERGLPDYPATMQIEMHWEGQGLAVKGS
ncbi:MAG: LacI family DNA-binding transcriptional regulator [bacterium]